MTGPPEIDSPVKIWNFTADKECIKSDKRSIDGISQHIQVRVVESVEFGYGQLNLNTVGLVN